MWPQSKFFWGENAEEGAYFTVTNCYENLHGPIDEQREKQFDIQEQRESDFIFKSLTHLPSNFSDLKYRSVWLWYITKTIL